MTRASELRALAARVEAAQGADWDLDKEIADACLDYNMGDDEVPTFTASLDAAASLVPAKWRFTLGSHGVAACLRGWMGEDGYQVTQPSRAATPALALTAAALRALAEEAGHE
jgi:hypothetical protein